MGLPHSRVRARARVKPPPSDKLPSCTVWPAPRAAGARVLVRRNADTFRLGEKAERFFAAFAADAAGFHAAEAEGQVALPASVNQHFDRSARFLLRTEPEVQPFFLIQLDISWHAEHGLLSFHG